jgi:hypothetical protein
MRSIVIKKKTSLQIMFGHHLKFLVEGSADLTGGVQVFFISYVLA